MSIALLLSVVVVDSTLQCATRLLVVVSLWVLATIIVALVVARKLCCRVLQVIGAVNYRVSDIVSTASFVN